MCLFHMRVFQFFMKVEPMQKVSGRSQRRIPFFTVPVTGSTKEDELQAKVDCLEKRLADEEAKVDSLAKRVAELELERATRN